MYLQREPLGGMGQNKIWSILTVENAAGGAIGGGLMYGLAQAFRIAGQGFGAGFWLQAILILAGIAIGAAVTIRTNGLSLVDRVTFFVGFQLRKAGGQHRIDPPIESSVWAMGADADDLLLPLIDPEMLLTAEEAERGS